MTTAGRTASDEHGATGGLYIHVPFCGSICEYCHFARTARHDDGLRRRYVDGVLAELALRREACGALAPGGRRPATCYLGGGTPSQLAADEMARLLAGTLHELEPVPGCEVTAEANPESLSPELARAWREAGINRVSLGVQSLDAGVLKRLGRACDPATARRALATATGVFGRVSADWILGPGVGREALLAELDEAVALGVEHFSLYILEVHEGTPLAARRDAGTWRPAPDRDVEALYLAAAERLAAHGVVQYEVANFARPGGESRHNRSYWRRRPWLGLGPGAHGGWGPRRYENHRDVHAWLAALAEGRLPEAEIDPLDTAARRLERVILALRTAEGVPVAWLPPRALDLTRGQSEGLWTIADGRLRLTGRGFLRIDGIEERVAAAG